MPKIELSEEKLKVFVAKLEAAYTELEEQGKLPDTSGMTEDEKKAAIGEYVLEAWVQSSNCIRK